MTKGYRLVAAMAAGAFGALAASFLPGVSERLAAHDAGAVSGLELRDASGKVYARLKRGDGEAMGLSFYNEAGQALLEMGLKTHRDVHRLDMGLHLTDPKEEPYFVYWDAKGKKHTVFGDFPWIP